jgi:hypothetical protein
MYYLLSHCGIKYEDELEKRGASDWTLVSTKHIGHIYKWTGVFGYNKAGKKEQCPDCGADVKGRNICKGCCRDLRVNVPCPECEDGILLMVDHTVTDRLVAPPGVCWLDGVCVENSMMGPRPVTTREVKTKWVLRHKGKKKVK